MRFCITLMASLIYTFYASTLAAEIGDVDCDGTRNQVELLESGPDAVVDAIREDPQSFLQETNEGWNCFPDPLEQRPPRNYIVSIDCIKRVLVRDKNADLKSAGTVFKKNFGRLLKCFEGEILQSAPSQIGSPLVTTETMNIILDRDVGNRKIILKYQYSLGNDGYIYWSIVAGYSQRPSR